MDFHCPWRLGQGNDSQGSPTNRNEHQKRSISKTRIKNCRLIVQWYSLVLAAKCSHNPSSSYVFLQRWHILYYIFIVHQRLTSAFTGWCIHCGVGSTFWVHSNTQFDHFAGFLSSGFSCQCHVFISHWKNSSSHSILCVPLIFTKGEFMGCFFFPCV